MSSENRRIKKEFISLLKGQDINFDESKRQLIDFFFNSEIHLSSEDLKRHVREKNLTVSDKTVQMLLDLLSDFGFAEKRVFEDGITRYEHLHLGEHHDHLICVRCRKIIEFHSTELEAQQDNSAATHRFHPFWHKMEIYGLCSSCFGESEGVSSPLSVIPIGSSIRVAELQGGGKMRQRLLDLGLIPGTEARVINNHMGLVALAIRGQRIGIGRGMSRRILVEIIE